MNPDVITIMPAGNRFQLLYSESDGQYQWRFLSANNRPVAMSFESFAEAEGCRVAVDDLRQHVAEAELSFRPVDRGKWRWLLSAQGKVIARSAVIYDRQSRCADGGRRFVTTAAAAPTESRLLVIRPTRSVSRYGVFNPMLDSGRPR